MRQNITVVVNCFNRKEFVLEALKSVCSQSIPRTNYEIILIKNFYDKKIDSFVEDNGIKEYIVHEVNGSWFEEAVKNSCGDFISFLEDDDLMHPNKLEIIQSLIKSDPDIVYIHNKLDSLNSDFNYSKFDTSKIKYFELNSNSQLRKSLKNRYYFNLSSITIRKDVICAYLPFIKNTNYGPDFLMFSIACISRKKMIEYDFPLTYYRIHFDSPANFKSKNIVEFEKAKRIILPSIMNNWKTISNFNGSDTLRDYARLRFLTTEIWLNLVSEYPIYEIKFSEIIEEIHGISVYPLFMLFIIVYYFDKMFHKASKKIYYNVIDSWIGWRLRENV